MRKIYFTLIVEFYHISDQVFKGTTSDGRATERKGLFNIGKILLSAWKRLETLFLVLRFSVLTCT